MSMFLNDIELRDMENGLCDEHKAILKCLRENLKNYLKPEDIPDFWINEVILKCLILENCEQEILAKIWNPESGYFIPLANNYPTCK